MKAVLMAAGYGTRLGDLTKKTPKPIIEIDGKSILEHIIERLHIHGIREIIVNVHYLPMVITERINSNALYFYEPKLLGHEGTLSALKQWLEDDDFFTINGDTLSNVDYTQMQIFHEPKTITVLMDNWRAAGTWLYSKEYFKGYDLPVRPYRPLGLDWADIGTPERLAEARKKYENIS